MPTHLERLFKGAAAAPIIALSLSAAQPAFAQEAPKKNEATVTISAEEYERLKKGANASTPIHQMSLEQLIVKMNGDKEKAWDTYEFYGLRKVKLEEAVTDESAERIIKQIQILDELDTGKPITLVINSGGGSVVAGLGIYNAMMASKSPVNTYCDERAASMAAVLFSAGRERTVSQGCHFLIHNVSAGASGNSSKMIEGMSNTLGYENRLTQILSENSGLSLADLKEIMNYDLYYNSEEVIKLGFADSLEGHKPRDLRPGSKKVPRELMPDRKISDIISRKMGLDSPQP